MVLLVRRSFKKYWWVTLNYEGVKIHELLELIRSANTLIALYAYKTFSMNVVNFMATNVVKKWYYKFIINRAIQQQENKIKAKNYG